MTTPATPTPKTTKATKAPAKVTDLAAKRTAKAAAKAPATKATPAKATPAKTTATKVAAKRTTKATPAKAPTDSPRSQRPLFVDHVHPETYTMSDDLDMRSRQLHKRWADCEASMCTWADQTDAARESDSRKAVELRAELRAARSTITPAQGAQLAELYAEHVRAQDAFEQLCAALVVDEGASPSHVGKAIGIGNSQVRRIVWRARPEAKPEGY